jgi:hypothetical protein
MVDRVIKVGELAVLDADSAVWHGMVISRSVAVLRIDPAAYSTARIVRPWMKIASLQGVRVDPHRIMNGCGMVRACERRHKAPLIGKNSQAKQ